MTQRVQIPTYTDRWMMGDRYGEIVKIEKRLDRLDREIVKIRLDKSGKVMRFILADCTEV